ncbi:hypothetical protein [Paenibacillus gansuensis]|uniref:Alpha/beta hydrolase n=1 Tax=Paenibacillus gansuensis TaxID=306542 RepID=A0ABW5PBE8_9BACL
MVIKENWVTSLGTEIHYIESIPEEPSSEVPLFICPGLSMNAEDYIPLMKQRTADARPLRFGGGEKAGRRSPGRRWQIIWRIWKPFYASWIIRPMLYSPIRAAFLTL